MRSPECVHRDAFTRIRSPGCVHRECVHRDAFTRMRSPGWVRRTAFPKVRSPGCVPQNAFPNADQEPEFKTSKIEIKDRNQRSKTKIENLKRKPKALGPRSPLFPSNPGTTLRIRQLIIREVPASTSSARSSSQKPPSKNIVNWEKSGVLRDLHDLHDLHDMNGLLRPTTELATWSRSR